MNHVLRLACFALGCLLASEAGAQTDQKQALRKAYEAAFADPDNSAAFNAFLNTLPRSKSLFTGETLYLLEGDLPRTSRQVRAYLRARKKPPEETGTELKLHTVQGIPMCWRPEYRTLRYAVWRPSFDGPLKDNGAAYKKMVKTLRDAMDDWESVCKEECGIKFVHVPALDTATNKESLLDAVQEDRIRFFVYYEMGKDYARAFFPGVFAEDRNIEVNDPLIKLLNSNPPPNRLTARGVMRHELGHVLGYRHEHIETPNDNHCRKEPDALNTPTDITSLDGTSVMHYDCGNPDKPVGADDVISPKDIIGHRKVYGPQQPGHVCGVPVGAPSK